MNNNLLDLSGKIDPSLVEVFDVIAEVASARGISYFVVGATARDIILGHGHGMPAKRATVDVDFGVEVSDWDEFQALKEGLIATTQFQSTQSAHKLLFKHTLPVDIVPFGPLEHANKEISWPPDHNVRMNVLGFEDAYRNAQMVRLKNAPILDIPFATPAGLALLKVIAWNDRKPRGGKDAGDLIFLMRNYLDAGNQERLAEEHADLLDADDFDYERTGVLLLGLDMAKIMAPETRRVVLEILERETGDQKRYSLIEDMLPYYTGTGDSFGECLQFLEALKARIQEIHGK